ncbi:alpha/beta hydrolase [Mesorhizobium sp. CGMCC 1.15528]|uniref:Alpha/beta hydrolase n=1 Tax=Mesorhizobium zhangyense TaxID=1776730 RepID=A0A7C9VB48_9HYPH|nr:alpha/beta hydrolase [Mesorhizobium zhangyense]NGN41129.1 alpha/beta hydrolase [Mesorhizobium zhangyense]
MTDDADTDDLRILPTRDGQVGYRIGGEGPLVLLIASTGRCCAELWPLAKALQGHGFRVARVEPRGILPSRGPMRDVSFHDFATDFVTVLSAELGEGERAIVAGHAYGTWVARTVAADHPDIVAGVVLLASGAKQWPQHLSAAITAINAAETSDAERLAALRLGFFAEGNDAGEWLSGWHPEVVASQRAARALTPQSDWWETGTAPILDLMGGADPFRPTGSEDELVREFAGRVTAEAIPNASHAMPAEKPREAAATIARWWGGLKAGG